MARNDDGGTGPLSAASDPVTPMGNQTINFGAQAGQTFSPSGTFAINPLATVTSNLTIIYGSSTSSICTVNGSTVTMLVSGTCTLTADQIGNVAWNPAEQVTQSVAIAKAPQTLTFPSQVPASRPFEPSITFAISPLANSSAPNSGSPILYSSLSGSVCMVSGTTVTMASLGACQIAANQAGNDDFLAAAQVTTQVLLVTPPQADLWIQKTVAAPKARIGDTVIYSIVVGNDGPNNAPSVNVLDVPPALLNPSSVAWRCIGATGTTCPVPNSGAGGINVMMSLPTGSAAQFELTGEVISAPNPVNDFTTFDNTARVVLPLGSGLSDPAANSVSTATVRVIPEYIFIDGFETFPRP